MMQVRKSCWLINKNHAVSALVALAVLLTPAMAHDRGPGSWINNNKLTDPASKEWCCNEKDCEAIPPYGISETSTGYFIAESYENIPSSRVIWQSADGRWWRCRVNVFVRSSKTRCLIGPPLGL